MSKERSRDLLRRMTETKAFEEATDWMFWEKDEKGKWVKDNRRMLDRELALRFSAFYVTPLEVYATAESLNAFLLEFTRRIDGKSARHPPLSQTEVAKIEAGFEVAMLNARAILGNEAFRRPGVNGRRGPLNRAIFEAHALALAEVATDVAAAKKLSLAIALRGLFADPGYDSAVRVATGDVRNVRRRIERTREAVKGALK